MQEQVRLNGLVFSGDQQVVGVMNQILGSFAIKTEVCTEMGSAIDAVMHRRLDALVLDWNGNNDSSRLVRSARKSSPNSNSTIVAMVDSSSATHALLAGADFMIYKPVGLERARNCMSAAYGTMLQERRRAARVSVDIPVTARISGIGTLEVRISDLSVGGLALQCPAPIHNDREVSLVFAVPCTHNMVRVTGKVVNGSITGRAGIRFSFVPEEDRNLLESWLATELAKIENSESPAFDAIARD
jgi:CheY-like chemotaxis protein